jgi:hypothetical protein
VSVTLDQILLLTGRLDDATGFDSPRERFRRFLFDRVREPAMARVFVDECQHAPGDESRRALQDVIVLLGRFLGFHVTFDAPRAAVGARICGVWHAPNMDVLVELRADQDDGTAVEALSRAVTAVSDPSRGAAGLCVVAPRFMNRAALDASASATSGAVGVVALDALVSLTSLVSDARVSHGDIAKLFAPGVPFGPLLEMLGRCATSAAPARSAPAVPAVASTGFWILTVTGDRGTTPDQFLDVVVARRGVLGLTGDRPSNDAVRTGDRVCFHISGRGVVGHGRIAAPDAAPAGLRDAHRFRQLWRLEDVRLNLGAPVTLDAETDLRLRAARDPEGHTVVGIPRESFNALTTSSGAPAAAPAHAPRLVG